MPLLQPVDLIPPSELGPVHFIAVGGAGMSGIAAMYASLGIPVSGSDQADSPVLDELRALGITAFVGHDAAHLGDAQTVVVSTAVRESNAELAAARCRGLRVWHRSAALGALLLGKDVVAVSGTHGKTTTSAMIADMLAKLGQDPSFVVGAPVAATGTSYWLGTGPAFVIEADESDGSFLQYPPGIAVITNIEADHLDNWGTPQRYAAGFRTFAERARAVVVGGDDPGARALIEPLRRAGTRVLVAGSAPDADVRIAECQDEHGHPTATLDDGPLALAVPGLHNLRNAAVAYAAGVALGFGDQGERMRAALDVFAGTHRRFETVARVAGVQIVDDYAHHPTELLATLTAARDVAGERRVVACFQPHLFTRTRDFVAEFAQALALADEVVVLDVYPSREDPIPGVTGELIADAATGLLGGHVHYVERLADAPAALAQLVQDGDLVLTLGAGDVTTVGPRLATLLAGR